MAKSKKPKTPLERLTYAINAVREYDQITAAEWRSDYPEMARVLESRATGEDSIQSLNRELLTRLSEFIASLYSQGKQARGPELQAAIDEAREALAGDSNDAEHDALVSIMEALGEEIPEGK